MSRSVPPALIVICGPTATGKSGLALHLAQRLPSIILSADSRQVYREFNIGTAKPSPLEQEQVPHYLIDICDPRETLTLADYQHQAQQWIHRCHQGTLDRHSFAPISPNQYRIPLLVGGTGLYIRAIVRGLQIPRVPPQPNLRSQLAQLGQPLSYAFLSQVDPTAAQGIHPNDQTRTLRALEVFYTTGKPMSVQQGENPPSYPILQIGLDCDRSEHPDKGDRLTHRIALRTSQMMEQGFVNEVKTLCQRYGMDLPLLNTLGYSEIKQYLAGQISLAQAQDLIVLHTRQFAKRQRTWFRSDPSVHWFDSEAPDLIEQVWIKIQAFLAQISLAPFPGDALIETLRQD